MKLVKNILICIFVWIVLEVVVFNQHQVRMFLDNKIEKNIEISKDNISLINWKQEENKIISELDPMIVLEDLNMYVDNLEILVDMPKDTVKSTIFYMNVTGEQFSEDKMLTYEITNGKNILNINQYVSALRIDIGEEEGREIGNFTIVLNSCNIQFSIARMIAIIIIYLSAVGLFKLQGSPNYTQFKKD